MSAAADGQKEQKLFESSVMALDDSQPLTATNTLALFKMAIREEGLARKDDVVVFIEQKMEAYQRRQEGLRRPARLCQQAPRPECWGPLRTVARLEANIDGGSKSGPSPSASTTGSPSTWAGRSRESNIKDPGPAMWTPRAIFVRAWPPFGCPTHREITREEAQHLDARSRKAVDPSAEKLQTMPPYVCNHQISYRIREGTSANIFDLKRYIADATSAENIQVRGSPIRVALEQRAQRKLEYGQYAYASAVGELKHYAAFKDKCIDDGRALQIYVAQSRQELGKSTSWGW